MVYLYPHVGTSHNIIPMYDVRSTWDALVVHVETHRWRKPLCTYAFEGNWQTVTNRKNKNKTNASLMCRVVRVSASVVLACMNDCCFNPRNEKLYYTSQCITVYVAEDRLTAKMLSTTNGKRTHAYGKATLQHEFFSQNHADTQITDFLHWWWFFKAIYLHKRSNAVEKCVGNILKTSFPHRSASLSLARSHSAFNSIDTLSTNTNWLNILKPQVFSILALQSKAARTRTILSAYFPISERILSKPAIDPPIGIFEYCQSWCGNRTHFLLFIWFSLSVVRSFSCILESNKETWFKLKCKLSDTT